MANPSSKIQPDQTELPLGLGEFTESRETRPATKELAKAQPKPSPKRKNPSRSAGKTAVTGHAAKTAKRQRDFRAKLKKDGLNRVELKVPTDLKSRLQRIAAENTNTVPDFIVDFLAANFPT